jgi:GNAT superfamily N-acetyltransferase
MIREAKVSEVRRVAEFMKGFEKVTPLLKLDIHHTVEQYERFISKGIGAILMLLNERGSLHGGLGFITYPDLHSGDMMAVETFWYVDPNHRGRGVQLVREFEKRAKEQGCKKVAMIHLMDSYPAELENLYSRMGYTLIEKHYVKEV